MFIRPFLQITPRRSQPPSQSPLTTCSGLAHGEIERSLSGPKAATREIPRPQRSLPGPKGPPEPRSAAGESPGLSRSPHPTPPGPPHSPARRGRAPFVPTGRGGGHSACALRSALSTRPPQPARESLLAMGGLFGCPAPPRSQGCLRTLRGRR